MILLVVWDGLRPDTIQKESTPFLWEMAARGVFCRASHCVFPTATRINSASLTTGCYPRRHGLVDNELFVPALDAAKPVSCADWRLLQAMAESEGGRLLETPTLGEMLRDAGRSMVSVGSGSPGTTYLTNPTITGPIVNWAVSWPEEIARDIDQRYGGPLPPGSTSAERTAYVLRALYEVLLPERRPDLATIWLTEPDHTQHYEGLGSGEALMVLRQLDDHLRELVEEAASYGPLTCFLLSDHGFSTVQRLSADPLDELRAEGLLPEGAMLVRASNSLYFNDVARERLEEVVSFLLTRSWLGALFVREDLRERVPYLLPQGAVMCGHRRSAELLFAFRWSDEANEKGIPGS
ncbi:MAG: alkaline phosphatase family protein, partial [Chloroflexi bacterium]|nr:alkaline phosphatase family protein [Chloroflexota bacterium]